MKKFVLIASFLLLSVIINIVLFNEMTRIYRDMMRVQLDPGGTKIYVAENKKFLSNANESSRVVLFGDSRISMWKPSPVLDNAQVINRGRNGETSSMALLRLNKDVIALHPDVVIVQTGINDLKAIGVLPKNENDIIETTKKNINDIVSVLSKNKIQVILLTIIPRGGLTWSRKFVWTDRIDDSINIVNKHIMSLKSQYVEVLDLDTVLSKGGVVVQNYQYDSLHINSDAYLKLNGLIESVIIGRRAELGL